jgi:predicted ATPase/DNA-binding SARP family transcriptional activator
MLEVRLLGKFEVRNDNQAVEILLRAAQSLLAYLMLNAGTPHRREQLAGLFWPDMPDANAKSNLRQTLSRLRKAIGEQYLLADDLTIAFEVNADYWLDAQVLTRKVVANTSTADLIDAVSVYGGELLPGFYDEWVLLERERLQAAYEHKVALLLARLTAAQRWEEVLEWSERWIALGHTPEAAYRALITAHGARADVSSAAAAYQRCEEALRRDLGVEPSPQTRSALERARREAAAPIDLALFQRPRTNLPAALSSFIGREKEIAEVGRLITAQRAVTLTGSGGSGKTRLAIESSYQLIDHFADGVWLIEFAPLNDAALVPHAVAATLGLQETGGRSLVTTLIDVLREKHRLLIFDNCEHLIDACAQLATALLPACPQLHILATSREPLGIPGEIPFRVPPLSTPDVQHLLIIRDLAHFEAVQLFVERGTAVVTAYTVTADNAAAIARICQRLDGMPLAIELAAARLKTLRAEEIAARLDDRFHLLTGGSRAALPRQQTLRATIEWSYNLLSIPEQTLLQRLSVFVGGWTLEAAEFVGANPGVGADLRVGPLVDTPNRPVRLSTGESGASWGRIDPYNVLDLLTHLADKSLVNVDRTQGQETRYGMLETIRQYAREKLIESGEEAALRQRHLDYYMQLAERAEPELVSFDQFTWLDRLEAEFDNIRTALEWSLTSDVEGGLRLASALRWFWTYSMHFRESSDYLARLLRPSASHGVALPIRAKALAVQADLMNLRNEPSQSVKLAEESLALCRVAGDEQGETLALLALARAFSYLGRASAGQQLCERCLALSRARNDPIRAAQALWMLALFESHRPRRIELLEEVRAIRRTHGHWVGLVNALHELAHQTMLLGDYSLADRWLNESKDLTRHSAALAELVANEMHLSGRLALREGDYTRARTELEKSAQRSQEAGRAMNFSWTLSDLGYVALCQGDFQRARATWQQSLHNFREANYPIGVVFNVEGLASLAVQQGQPARAARLLAWADATREVIEDTRPPVEQADVDRDLAIIGAQLNDATFQAEQAAGRQMTLDEAIACALSEEVVN